MLRITCPAMFALVRLHGCYVRLHDVFQKHRLLVISAATLLLVMLVTCEPRPEWCSRPRDPLLRHPYQTRSRGWCAPPAVLLHVPGEGCGRICMDVVGNLGIREKEDWPNGDASDCPKVLFDSFC